MRPYPLLRTISKLVPPRGGDGYSGTWRCSTASPSVGYNQTTIRHSSQAFGSIQRLDDGTAPIPPLSGSKQVKTTSPQKPELVTLETIRSLYNAKTPITVLTAHDFATGRIVATSSASSVDPSGIDICLCGDSLANVCLGYESTTELGLEEFVYHAQSVRRALDSLKREHVYRMPFFLADLPFGSFETSVEQGLRSAIELVRKARIDGLKIEGGLELIPLIQKLTNFGIPVFGHIGLTPQRAASLGGFKVQGHDSPLKAKQIISDAIQLEKAGCSGLIIEAVPKELVDRLIPQLSIPVIGIGAGPSTDGQVLVLNDLIGALDSHRPKFVPTISPDPQSLNSNNPTFQVGLDIINQYIRLVRNREFPIIGRHTYKMKPNVLQELDRTNWL